MVALTSDMSAEGLFVIGTTISNQIGGITDLTTLIFSSVSYDEDANYSKRKPKATITKYQMFMMERFMAFWLLLMKNMFL